MPVLGTILLITIIILLVVFLIVLIPDDKSDKDMHSKIKVSESKLQRHDLQVAVHEGRILGDDYEQAVKYAKKRLASQIMCAIDDCIEINKDDKLNCFILKVSIWTKEAADEKNRDCMR